MDEVIQARVSCETRVEKIVLTEILNRIVKDQKECKTIGSDIHSHLRCLVIIDEYSKELGVKL